MTDFPKALRRLMPNLLHAFIIPLFFMATVLCYEPKALVNLMHCGESHSAISNILTFNVVICFAIMLVTLSLSRVLLWLLRKRLNGSLWDYLFWCVMETAVCCVFTSLYLALMDHFDTGSWFSYFGRCLSSIGTVIMWPYLVLTLLYYALQKQAEPVPEDDMRLKFYDGRHQLKFITEASSVLFLESNENYVVIHYLENGTPKRFQIRNSMKNVEPLCEKAGFVRTHRCYIVNPRHVKLIRKEQGGVNVADLGLSEAIPISKKYYDNIAAIL